MKNTQKTGQTVVFDWNNLAFGSKKPINSLKATFIAAPRTMSRARFAQLIKAYLPKGNIVLGLAKEPYVLGMEDQPQFTMLGASQVQSLIDKVNASPSPHKIYTLNYFQRDTTFLFEKITVQHVVLVNGSWHRSFHLRPEYYVLVNRGISFEHVSPFTDDAEAKAFEASITPATPKPGTYSAKEMLELASGAAKGSYDNSFQVGVALGKKSGKGYKLLASTFNRVVPFQTYAMHYGASREQHFSPANDLNYYDTVHAEVELIIYAQKTALDLAGTTLFINVLPCPSCTRMFTETDIQEFVYREDHSDGYGVSMLQKAGKKVTRIVE